jgi:hypothetical protein
LEPLLVWEPAFETALIPAGIALGAEKYGSLIVVNAVDLLTFGCEKKAHLGADETLGSCDQNLFHLFFSLGVYCQGDPLSASVWPKLHRPYWILELWVHAPVSCSHRGSNAFPTISKDK